MHSNLLIMQSVILYTVIFLFVAILYIIVNKKAPLQQPDADIEKKILQNHVLFYQQLNDKDKIEFEKRIRHFLETVRIQGIETAIEDRDKVFVAAAAIIPIFAF
ncbi:MAG TPA: zinc-dependent peptidase, partial [Bacteroidia bacterium]|nr:zinc-dependent peptidase [Bacteroidia bacterium]